MEPLNFHSNALLLTELKGLKNNGDTVLYYLQALRREGEACMYAAVTSVKPVDNYKLLLEFENKGKRIFDIAPYLSTGKFAELRDLSLFKSVTVKFDSIEWANHLDLDPEFLYDRSIKADS